MSGSENIDTRYTLAELYEAADAEGKEKLMAAVKRQHRLEQARLFAEEETSDFAIGLPRAVHEAGRVVSGSLDAKTYLCFVVSHQCAKGSQDARTIYVGADNKEFCEQLNIATIAASGPAFCDAYDTFGDDDLPAKLLCEPSIMLSVSAEQRHKRFDIDRLKKADCSPADIIGNLRFNFLLCRWMLRHDLLIPFAEQIRLPIEEGKAAAIDSEMVKMGFRPVVKMAVEVCCTPQIWKSLADAQSIMEAVEDVAPMDGTDARTWVLN